METPSALCRKKFGLCVIVSLPEKAFLLPELTGNTPLLAWALESMHLPLHEQVAGNGPFVPGHNISHSFGKWLSFFFFLGIGCQLHAAPRASKGSRAGSLSVGPPPHPPGCSGPFSPFLKVGFRRASQLPLSSVAFVNFCRPARLHCLGDFMFDF